MKRSSSHIILLLTLLLFSCNFNEKKSENAKLKFVVQITISDEIFKSSTGNVLIETLTN